MRALILLFVAVTWSELFAFAPALASAEPFVSLCSEDKNETIHFAPPVREDRIRAEKWEGGRSLALLVPRSAGGRREGKQMSEKCEKESETNTLT